MHNDQTREIVIDFAIHQLLGPLITPILFSNSLDKFSTAHCAYIVKQGCPQFIPWSLQSIEKENEMVIAGGGLFAVRNEHLATDDGRYSSLHNDPNKHIIWNKRSSSYR